MLNREKLVVTGVFAALLAVVLLVPLFRLAGGQVDSAPANPSRTPLPPQFRGIWLELHNNDPGCPYEDYVREIAATGANAVCLSISAEQENGSATVIYVDSRKVPDRNRLVALFKLIHSLDKQIVFMPKILLTRPSADEWRGKINPDDWSPWWQNYTDFILPYAALAQENGVRLFMIGTELVSTERFEDRWRELIRRIRRQSAEILDRQFRGHLRARFPSFKAGDFRQRFGIEDLDGFAYSRLAESSDAGPSENLTELYREFAEPRRMLLSYSANWDHFKVPKWWDDLDMIGMTSYHNINSSKAADPTLESLCQAWQPIRQEIAAWQRGINKPVFFTEVGWASQDGCSIEAWNYFHSKTMDLVEQRLCMESFLRTFAREPWVGGVLVWKWRDHPGITGDLSETDAGRLGYTPYRKPVMDVIREFFASPNPPWRSAPPSASSPASRSVPATEPSSTQPTSPAH